MRSLLVACLALLALVPAAGAARRPTAGEHAQLVAGATLYAHLIAQTPPARALTARFSGYKVSTAGPGYAFGGVTFSGKGTTLETLGLLLQRSGSFWGVVDGGCCDAYVCQSAVEPVYRDWLGTGQTSICPGPRERHAPAATASIPGVATGLVHPA